jgi:hypothetical protein
MCRDANGTKIANTTNGGGGEGGKNEDKKSGGMRLASGLSTVLVGVVVALLV